MHRLTELKSLLEQLHSPDLVMEMSKEPRALAVVIVAVAGSTSQKRQRNLQASMCKCALSTATATKDDEEADKSCQAAVPSAASHSLG